MEQFIAILLKGQYIIAISTSSPYHKWRNIKNVDFDECTIRRTFQKNLEIIHSFEIPEHKEDRNTLNVHVLGTTEVSDSLGIDEEAERCRKKYDKNIG